MAQSGRAQSSGGFVYKAPAKVLLDSLVRRGLVPPEETAPLLEAARVTRRSVCLLILDLGLLDEAALAQALVHAYSLPYINLACYTVDSDILELVDPGLCWERRVLPLDMVGSSLTLAMVDPLDDRTVSRVSAENQIYVCRTVALSSELTAALERHYATFAKPATTFGHAEAVAALKSARASLAEVPVRQTKQAERQLPGWLRDDDGDDDGEPESAGAPPDEMGGLPDWLDSDDDVSEERYTPGEDGKPSVAAIPVNGATGAPLSRGAGASRDDDPSQGAKRKASSKKVDRKKRRPKA